MENDKLLEFDDPRVIVEVLSPSTREQDKGSKLREYMAIKSLDAIIHVDPDGEEVRLLTRTKGHGWQDVELEKGADVRVEALNVTLTWSEIFARA